MLKTSLFVMIFSLISAAAMLATGNNNPHITTRDIPIVDEAFLHGYTHCLVTDYVDGKAYPTLGIQCVNNRMHEPQEDTPPDKKFFSVWARDLYWGFLGWAQAGDDSVLPRMKSSIRELILCKNGNKAGEHAQQLWTPNNGRYHIPQAFTIGGVVAKDFIPYCSESQADFLLLTHLYWKMSGDTNFISEIWADITYVTETIELLDTNGNSLPDNLTGSYDYQWMGKDMEEPLMCAKASAAYHAVADMAEALGKKDISIRLEALSESVRAAMNRPTSDDGLWKSLPDGGYYINRHIITKGNVSLDEQFIPYENLVPMFFGMTSKEQDQAIFRRLDVNFDRYYKQKWGPMYIAPAIKTPESVIDCSTTPWLGFLDVYLRCRHNARQNRSEIFSLLLNHAYAVPEAPFSEGAGITGCLTNNSGRSWDNGNFFHCLVNGIYGIEKSSSGITVTPPVKLKSFPLTELKNVHWRNAVYDFKWEGNGPYIETLSDNGEPSKPITGTETYLLSAKSGRHKIVVKLGYLRKQQPG